jgi:N-acetylmuramoyl-L-alanine amidase
MLLDVSKSAGKKIPAWNRLEFHIELLFSLFLLGIVALILSDGTPSQARQSVPLDPSAETQTTISAQSTTPQSASPQGAAPQTPPVQHTSVTNIVVLDPAHGGVDPGARGTGGMRESEIVLDFAGQVRRALEGQGFQVVQTRGGNENPSFDDRSAMANAQASAIFVTLHISSTGLAGTARVYVNSDMPVAADASGLISWDRAQIPFQGLSRRLGDLVQGHLAERFKGSPATAQTAAVRQLRTTAAPAIAVEVSSVVVEDRADLDRMGPGVADAIARGIAEFRPFYVLPSMPGGTP